MVNLLSEQQLFRRDRVYMQHVLALSLMAFSVVMVVATLLVGPFVLSYAKAEDAYRAEIARIDEVLATTDLPNEEAIIEMRTPLLHGAAAAHAVRPLSAVVEQVAMAARGSVKILSMNLSLSGISMSVAGEAPDRQALVTFADTLRAAEGIAFVDVPIANFVEGRDASFSISFILKPYAAN